MIVLKLGSVLLAFILAMSSMSHSYPIEELKKEADRLRHLYELAVQQQQAVTEGRGNAGPLAKELLTLSDYDKKNPYSDYSNEERKNLELAHIMEIAKIMQSKLDDEKPTATKPGSEGSPLTASPDTLCHSNGSDESLTYGELKNIIDTLYQIFESDFSVTEHFIAADYGMVLSHNSNPLHALQVFLSKTFPTAIWMNKSPCIHCARRLMQDYSDKDTVKPTIYIANVTVGATLNDTLESFKCMSRMVHQGFTLAAFNWESFSNNLSNMDCKNAITTALNTPEFVEARSNTANILQYITEASTSEHIMSWCDPDS